MIRRIGLQLVALDECDVARLSGDVGYITTAVDEYIISSRNLRIVKSSTDSTDVLDVAAG